MQSDSRPINYCPKCGSDKVLDYSHGDLTSPNPMPMFCRECHSIGTIEEFSKPPGFGKRGIKLLPLVIAGSVSFFVPFSITVKTIIAIVLYIFLFSITWRRADGRRAFPPYLW
jgi:hypothetical protein